MALRKALQLSSSRAINQSLKVACTSSSVKHSASFHTTASSNVSFATVTVYAGLLMLVDGAGAEEPKKIGYGMATIFGSGLAVYITNEREKAEIQAHFNQALDDLKLDDKEKKAIIAILESQQMNYVSVTDSSEKSSPERARVWLMNQIKSIERDITIPQESEALKYNTISQDKKALFWERVCEIYPDLISQDKNHGLFCKFALEVFKNVKAKNKDYIEKCLHADDYDISYGGYSATKPLL